VKPFFPPTRDAEDRITHLFDFIWPTAAALWNLRWQVQGFLKEIPDASSEQLHQRFVFGSSVQGTNLRRSCTEISWEDQRSIFADFILTNAFAIYEFWADEILDMLGVTRYTGKDLQFEQRIDEVINHTCAQVSDTLAAAFYPSYSQTGKYSRKLMPNLLRCYRYFKSPSEDFMSDSRVF
jgi:hypothetical protein